MTLTGATVVYGLCLLSSVLCAWLLVRAFLRSRTKFLLWSALCFVLLALNNMLVFIDLQVLPDLELYWFRQVTVLAAVGVLLYGFIWEAE